MRATKAVLKALTKVRGRPVATADVLSAVAARGIPEDAARKALRMLVDSGRIVALSDDRYVAVAGPNLQLGRIAVHRRGFGFVETPSGDVYVRAKDMNGALHRDLVAVRVSQNGRRGTSGEVAYVAERANATIVGRFDVEGRLGVVTPTDRRVRTDVLVPPASFGEARRGDIVVARVTRFPTSRDAAQGVVEEVLGPEGAPGIDVEVIIREHGLRTAFPADVAAAADAIGSVVETLEGRTDLRDLFTVTIDPVDARDFDDAVSVSREGSGWRLWVHVADVSSYVLWDSPIDREARARATSVYLVDRVLPMLPEALSNGTCSLAPEVDRLCVTVEMGLDKTGLVHEYRLYPSLVRSDYRLDYDAVDSWLQADVGFPSDHCAVLLREFKALAARLAARRTARGGLDFETVEAKVWLEPDGTPTGVTLRQRTVATNMIEEAMIAANEVVARHMTSHDSPMVFRIHEDPDPDALEQLGTVLAEFDYPVRDVRDASPATFQKIVAHAHGRPERLLVNSLLIRALKRARYVDFRHTHFGLASEAYTHFTSPIRRYPDLVVHRLLKAQLDDSLRDGSIQGMIASLGWLAEHCSVMEREAEAAEDESVKLKLAELMSEHLGEEFDGVITGVSSFGFFVQLQNTAEGLVHVESLLDDYYRLDAERFLLRGDARGRAFRLGQEVRVRIVDVVVSERRIELEAL